VFAPSAPRSISKVEEQAVVAHQDGQRPQASRPSPRPRSVLIFSSPGQSSCLSIVQLGSSVWMRRMTPGVICTLKVSG
jgi:hypothetical protein